MNQATDYTEQAERSLHDAYAALRDALRAMPAGTPRDQLTAARETVSLAIDQLDTAEYFAGGAA